MTKLKLLIIPLIIGVCSCESSPPTVPSATIGCAVPSLVSYICASNPTSPVMNTIEGNGQITLSVVGNDLPQFNQIVKYTPKNYTFGNVNVVLQNGTGSTGGHKLNIVPSPNGSIVFDIPDYGSFSISIKYTEYGVSAPDNASTGNLSNCINPGPNACHVWYYNYNANSGTNINAACDNLNLASNFSVSINNKDDVFPGNCE